jgi:hypothetical protein
MGVTPLLQTPPPLCDFEQWIDTEIKKADMRLLQGLKEWDGEHLEILEKRRREETVEKEHKKRRKGGVLLRIGRRRRRSLSACAERRYRWRRILMPRKRESGLVALSSWLVVWFNHR